MDNKTFLALSSNDALVGLLIEANSAVAVDANQAWAALVAQAQYWSGLPADEATALILDQAMAGTTLTAEQAMAKLIADYQALRLNGNPMGRAIIDKWVDFSLNAPASQFTLTSRAISKDSLVGQYTGAVTFPYEKRDLSVLLPYPFVIPLAYPTTFVMLMTYMLEHYGILLEEGEFTADSNTQTTVLAGTDAVDALPDAVTGYVILRAAPSSGRFVTDSTIRLLLTSPAVQVPLTTLLALDSKLDMHLLTDH